MGIVRVMEMKITNIKIANMKVARVKVARMMGLRVKEIRVKEDNENSKGLFAEERTFLKSAVNNPLECQPSGANGVQEPSG